MRAESSCEAAFHRGGPYWHLYTDGEKMEIIFTSPEDFMFGITLLGICIAAFPKCRILTFTLMSNHLHIILAGLEQDVLAFFELYKERLKRYLSGMKRYCRMQNFEAELFQIPDLRALRNEIIYVNRNGYVVSPDCTPFSYWWSAGVYFFNPMGRMLPLRPFSSLPIRVQRSMCHCREMELPKQYQVLEDIRPQMKDAVGPMLFPPSFCAIQEAEGFYLDAHHYFRQLSRDQEAFSAVAKRLGERIFLTDEELYGAVCAICAKEFGCNKPILLPGKDKQEVARRMHFDYNATNKQIQRMLKLSAAGVEELFPRAEPVHKKGCFCG